MSEFQLYQFQAIDAPLTHQQKQYMHDLSSRAQVSAYSAQYQYHYSDFPEDINTVLLYGFDLALYQANWGAVQLLIRLPTGLVDVDKLRVFCITDLISVYEEPDSIVLDISFDDEEGGRWIEAQGELAEIAGIRAMLLNGDYRPLYLAWLKAVQWQNESDVAVASMIIPAGFNSLEPSLQALAGLFELERDLITAVAKYSPELSDAPKLMALGSLSAQECTDWLQRLLDAEPLLVEKLTQRLTLNTDEVASSDLVTVSTLLKQAEQIKSQRLAAIAEAKQQERLAYLTSLIPKQTQLWQTVLELIEQKQAKPYDQAIMILVDLSELAQMQHHSAEFKVKTNELLARYSNRSALKSRFKSAQLL
ncbi:hypothetical protein WNY63_00155 [Pseudoalteromonas neustonica]|uniref:HDOD domain-containing protein n=1 Tax=Pseudoalteromonas neustonica TaxID=1840331 RepID=A0ABU9TXA9_9GAMM